MTTPLPSPDSADAVLRWLLERRPGQGDYTHQLIASAPDGTLPAWARAMLIRRPTEAAARAVMARRADLTLEEYLVLVDDPAPKVLEALGRNQQLPPPAADALLARAIREPRDKPQTLERAVLAIRGLRANDGLRTPTMAALCAALAGPLADLGGLSSLQWDVGQRLAQALPESWREVPADHLAAVLTHVSSTQRQAIILHAVPAMDGPLAASAAAAPPAATPARPPSARATPRRARTP